MREIGWVAEGLSNAVRGRVASVTASVLVIAVSPLLGGIARADSVVAAGFCLRIENHECVERVANGSRVRMRDLPRDAEGRRIIYFHSVTDIEHARFFLHSFARGPAGTPGTVRAEGGNRGEVPEDLRQLARTFRLDERGDVMNFIIGVNASYQRFRVATPRHVHSYGPLAANVIDPEGNEMPGSELVEIEIVP